jgi:hypothetical protein
MRNRGSVASQFFGPEPGPHVYTGIETCAASALPANSVPRTRRTTVETADDSSVGSASGQFENRRPTKAVAMAAMRLEPIS